MKEWIQKHWILIFICLIAFIVMIPGLSRPYFWQDEAESALLAKSILDDGLPYAWVDGNLVTQLSGNDSNEDYLWSFTPWLPFYIIAASFKMLGISNFAGRLPFVIIGILGLITLYLFVYTLTRERIFALLSSLVLLLNFQFILYSRQCKYYSIFFLIPPLLYLAYSRLKDSFSHFIGFIICILILFYTNYVTMFTSLFGLTLYVLLVKRNKKEIIRFFLAGLISICLTFPFFTIGDIQTSSSLISKLPSVPGYFEKLARHIWYFNNMVFGLVLFIPLIFFLKSTFFTLKEKKFVKFLIWIIVPAWLVLPLFNQDVFRYNLELIPIFSILVAFIILGFFRWNKLAGILSILIILGTNISFNFPAIAVKAGLKLTNFRFEDQSGWISEKFSRDEEDTVNYFRELDRKIEGYGFEEILLKDVFRTEYVAYINELKGDYPDAIKETVDFLRNKADKGDQVYANFDLLSLMFYLPNLRYAYVVDRNELRNPKDPPLPSYITSLKGVNWYFHRDIRMNLGPYISYEDFSEKMVALNRTMEPHELNISTLYWDVNWPQYYYAYINKMLWKEDQNSEKIVIYEITKH